MPLYDYQCQACQHTFELLVRASTVPACPKCGSEQLEKLVSLPAPQGKIAGLVAAGRAQAAKEGHFSNYSAKERPKIG
ncbi:FmdB family zinc ribbon protein [Azospira oryzae]|uniref:FmdB family zinc ribbon protein n=1 Tax=Azospira oryzae TaxID=146939 RepID=UPI001966567D|nr:zinc ribbon domain-containing protein [Azospira oryzae]